MVPFMRNLRTGRVIGLLLIILGVAAVAVDRAALEERQAVAAEIGPQQDRRMVPPESVPPADSGRSIPLTKKQKQDLLKYNFEKMRRDADELTELAKSLQEDLSKSNENILSLKVVDKAEKIEKLAKQIKGAAKGY